VRLVAGASLAAHEEPAVASASEPDGLAANAVSASISMVVVFGHSHQPLCEVGVDGQLLVNPGSPVERRRSPTHTIAVLDLHDGRVEHARIVDV
jgi:predicted phosphodiesterase